MENHDQQSQEMRQHMQVQNKQICQQNEQMQHILLQHFHIQSIIPAPSPLTTTTDETEQYVDDALVDRPHDMSKDH